MDTIQSGDNDRRAERKEAYHAGDLCRLVSALQGNGKKGF